MLSSMVAIVVAVALVILVMKFLKGCIKSVLILAIIVVAVWYLWKNGIASQILELLGLNDTLNNILSIKAP